MTRRTSTLFWPELLLRQAPSDAAYSFEPHFSGRPAGNGSSISQYERPAPRVRLRFRLRLGTKWVLIPGDVAHPFRNDLAHRFRDDVAHRSDMMSPG